MVSFLTQLRQGYIERSQTPFPASVVLVGQRQIRDYALREEDRKAMVWLSTRSPFNITAEATTLGPFTEAEIGELLSKHTELTGQRFLAEAVARIWELGLGHPWLTNADAQVIAWREQAMDEVDDLVARGVGREAGEHALTPGVGGLGRGGVPAAQPPPQLEGERAGSAGDAAEQETEAGFGGWGVVVASASSARSRATGS
jgi:hypothetical protein